MKILCKGPMRLESQKRTIDCMEQKLQCVGSTLDDPAREVLESLDATTRHRFDQLESSRKRSVYRKLQEAEWEEKTDRKPAKPPETEALLRRESGKEKIREFPSYGAEAVASSQKIVFPAGKAENGKQDGKLVLQGLFAQEWRQAKAQKSLKERLQACVGPSVGQIQAVKAKQIPVIKKWHMDLPEREPRILYFTGSSVGENGRKGSALVGGPEEIRIEKKRETSYLIGKEKETESRKFGQQASGSSQVFEKKKASFLADAPGVSRKSQALQSARRMIQHQFSAQLQKEESKKEAQAEAYTQTYGTVAAATAVSQSKNPLLKAISGFLLVMVQLFTKVLLSKILLVFLCLIGMIAAVATLFSVLATQTAGHAEAKVSAEVEFYRPYLEAEAAKYPGMSQLVDLMLAIIQQEAGGESWIGTMDGDIMQSSESAGYPGPGYLTGEASIAQGVKYLYGVFSRTGLIEDPYNLELTKISLQSYNFGIGFYDWFERNGHTRWSFEIAVEYAKIGANAMGWSVYRSDPLLISYAGPINYGDQRYPEHVLQYYEITSGVILHGGMAIPLYYQWEYGDVAYGGGSIATSGCGPTSFAMVASYLTGRTITPVDAVSWCGNAYYVPGAGTAWSYFSGACSHFGLAAPVQTNDMQSVLLALQEGKPVISSQGPGLFTSAGHFIVLRGVDENGRVLVNDPNDNANKNYQNRAFDMTSEIHPTSLSYWIFSN